ncbi:MAG: nucleotidyltransferase domain-containing protein [Candidatus Methanoplasma sp.]|jgi:predicted nucleotidyltransferase|nr:nucleotidyltransferase domain-containing protein [Candidatus Methanoplasma sp.]
MTSKDKLSVEELRRAITPIAERHGVESIVLFGSVARGDDNDDSDYDFCIDPGCIKDYDELAHLVKDMEGVIRSEVDVVTLGGVRPDSMLMRNIRKEGIVVYSRTA